jgi:recombinational DNA repair protein RecR
MTDKIKKCMVCGKPSEQTICEVCKAEIQGEALDKKIRIDKQLPISEVPIKKMKEDT